MDGEKHEALLAIGDRLAEMEERLNILIKEVQRSGLPAEKAEEVLDRLDEMMDLLYFIDERLEAALAGEDEP
ncbi:MAG: hypothetical protein GX493_00325 [Firmicutes bacterium]|nr:hypothetical protein [Bacillota bacterium]